MMTGRKLFRGLSVMGPMLLVVTFTCCPVSRVTDDRLRIDRIDGHSTLGTDNDGQVRVRIMGDHEIIPGSGTDRCRIRLDIQGQVCTFRFEPDRSGLEVKADSLRLLPPASGNELKASAK